MILHHFINNWEGYVVRINILVTYKARTESLAFFTEVIKGPHLTSFVDALAISVSGVFLFLVFWGVFLGGGGGCGGSCLSDFPQPFFNPGHDTKK